MLKPTAKANQNLIKFAEKFHLNDFGWIEAKNESAPTWLTNKTCPLSREDLVVMFLDADKLIGVGFGKKTKYLTIDLDRLSNCHPRNNRPEYQRLLAVLEEQGLVRSLLLQSSRSGGVHLYYPLPDQYPTYHVAALAQIALIEAGFKVANGEIEIFPNCKGYATGKNEYIHYKRHRIPFQPGSESYLLDRDGEPQNILPTTEAQIAAFLAQWEWCAQGQDRATLERKLPLAYKQYKQAKNRRKYQQKQDKSAKARAWEAALDLAIQTGWTGHHQTQILARQILQKGVVFLRLAGEKLIDWGVETLTSMPGYAQYCRHQHEIGKIFKSWVKTNERTGYYQPYCSHPDRANRYPFDSQKKSQTGQKSTNPTYAAQKNIARHRIITAYGFLLPTLTPDVKIGELRELIRLQTKKIFGVACSNQTLNKHKDLWHPDYIADRHRIAQPSESTSNLTTLSQIESKQPESNQSETSTPTPINNTEQLKTPQNQVPEAIAHPESPMICRPSGEPLENLHSTHPRAGDNDNTIVSKNLERQGKCEILGETLAKIISLAALVLNFAQSTGIISAPPELPTAEVEPPSTQIESQLGLTSSPSPSKCQPNQFETISLDLAASGAESTPLSETNASLDLSSLPPCDNPHVPSIHLVKYNPNRIGVPWTNQAELDKFAGYLVIVAKQDKSIKNPYAWATKALNNLKENGINRHWLEFTGDSLIDPDSMEAVFLRSLTNPQNGGFKPDLVRESVSISDCSTESELPLDDAISEPGVLKKGVRVQILATGQLGTVFHVWSSESMKKLDQKVRVLMDDTQQILAWEPESLAIV
jgi:hypothetical protein